MDNGKTETHTHTHTGTETSQSLVRGQKKRTPQHKFNLTEISHGLPQLVSVTQALPRPFRALGMSLFSDWPHAPQHIKDER